MGKVVPLFQSDAVNKVLCDAADQGLTELMLIGKRQDGGYFCRYSPSQNAFEYIGICEMFKHDLIHALDEQQTEG